MHMPNARPPLKTLTAIYRWGLRVRTPHLSLSLDGMPPPIMAARRRPALVERVAARPELRRVGLANDQRAVGLQHLDHRVVKARDAVLVEEAALHSPALMYAGDFGPSPLAGTQARRTGLEPHGAFAGNSVMYRPDRMSKARTNHSSGVLAGIQPVNMKDTPGIILSLLSFTLTHTVEIVTAKPSFANQHTSVKRTPLTAVRSLTTIGRPAHA